MNSRIFLFFSKENIFDPLKIELSFYPTPDLMEKLVALTIRRNEKIELYDPNIRVGERDPEKGTFVLFIRGIIGLTRISTSPTGRYRSLFLGS